MSIYLKKIILDIIFWGYHCNVQFGNILLSYCYWIMVEVVDLCLFYFYKKVKIKIKVFSSSLVFLYSQPCTHPASLDVANQLLGIHEVKAKLEIGLVKFLNMFQCKIIERLIS